MSVCVQDAALAACGLQDPEVRSLRRDARAVPRRRVLYMQDVEDLDDEVVFPMLEYIPEQDDVAGRHVHEKLLARYVRSHHLPTLGRRPSHVPVYVHLARGPRRAKI